jgi:hypothetical protein
MIVCETVKNQLDIHLQRTNSDIGPTLRTFIKNLTSECVTNNDLYRRENPDREWGSGLGAGSDPGGGSRVLKENYTGVSI